MKTPQPLDAHLGTLNEEDKMPLHYSGTTCQICDKENLKEIVDGRTKFGPWAWMCTDCHKEHGVGYGTGKGQRWDTETGKKLEG